MPILLPALLSGQTAATKDIQVGGQLSATYGLGCDGRPLGIFSLYNAERGRANLH
jgi:hypothetical protein